MQPRLETAAEQTVHHKGKCVHYVGRAPTSSVATGSKAAHKAEVHKVICHIFLVPLGDN
jgi:2-oxoglutarate dehydrogenase E1 component